MIKTATATADGEMVAASCYVVGVQYRAGATAGTVVLKDGGAGGTARLTIYTPASAAHAGHIPIPGQGLKFNTSVYVDVTQADGVTVIYEQA